jgi:hypothetical protein
MRKLRSPVPIERADEHLDKVSDVVTLILKGHLLVEEALFAAVQTKFPHPQYFLDANLRFTQLLSIAKGLFYTEEYAPVWDAIQALNIVRNRLAHRLEPSVGAEELKKISLLMPVPNGASLNHPEAGNLINAGIGAILAFLWLVPSGTGPEANNSLQPTRPRARG